MDGPLCTPAVVCTSETILLSLLHLGQASVSHLGTCSQPVPTVHDGPALQFSFWFPFPFYQLQNLLSKFWPKAEVQLISFEDSERKTKTKITFESFDVSSQDGVVILRPEEQLQHIISLGHAHITVTDDSIYWDGRCETCWGICV